jgi:hypothetical protein
VVAEAVLPGKEEAGLAAGKSLGEVLLTADQFRHMVGSRRLELALGIMQERI